ncbi:LysR substrate-binding domain-containing protein [Samsonia erythrinae]|uniref:DNA-binding transcriptional LysR family regulator n=1 Tax=Samsonia erythrinae TaxID=160434 RepID=A0A4R3VTF3_9GAMM|nr:LysR substrate-binding domain-containing protein [Samsonia erythrinae]TCV08567.1 DNA-binding transcriptional LysR family regulator [Samsonia erythrinae]
MVELRHLRYFVVLARELHFGHAASALHIEQPALSHNLRQLEEELGVRLFVRNTRKVELTEAGRTYLHKSIRLIQYMDNAAHAAQKAEQGGAGYLNFGYDNCVVLSRMPAAIKQFQRSFPDVELIPHENIPDRLLEQVLTGKLDVIYTCGGRRHPQLDSVTLEMPSWLCAIHKDHPLAAKNVIHWRDLRDEKLALPPYSSMWELHESLLSLCREADFVPHAPFSVYSPLAVFPLVSAGLCVSFTFNTGSAVTIPDVVFRPLLPTRTLQLQMCWSKNANSRTLTNFVEHCTRSLHSEASVSACELV